MALVWLSSEATFLTTALLASSSGLGLALGAQGSQRYPESLKQEADTMATFTFNSVTSSSVCPGPAQHGYQRPVDKSATRTTRGACTRTSCILSVGQTLASWVGFLCPVGPALPCLGGTTASLGVLAGPPASLGLEGGAWGLLGPLC